MEQEKHLLRGQIDDITSSVCSMVRSIAREEKFTVSQGQYQIDQDIKTVMEKVSTQIRAKNTKSINTVQAEETYINQMNDLKDQIQKIQISLLNYGDSFTNSLGKERQIFLQKKREIDKEFKVEKEEKLFIHNQEISKIQKEIDDMNATFETRLKAEIIRCQNEKEKFRKEYDELHDRFQEMKNRLEKELHDADKLVENVTAQLTKMETDNSFKMSSLQNNYQTKIDEFKEQYEFTIKKLDEEKEQTTSKINSFGDDHNDDLELLRDQLAKLNKVHEEQVQAKVDDKNVEFEDQYARLVAKYRNDEDDMARQLETRKCENELQRKQLEAKLSNTKLEIEAAKKANSDKMRIENMKSDQLIANLNQRVVKLMNDQKGVIELTKKRMANEIRELRRKNEQGMAQTKARVAQLVAHNEQQKKKLEAEVNGLIRTRYKLQFGENESLSSQLYSTRSNILNFYKFVDASVEPILDPKKQLTTINGITKYNQKLDSKTKNKSVELNNLNYELGLKFNDQKQRIVSNLEKSKMTLSSIEDEIRLAKIRKEELQSKMKTNQMIRKAEVQKRFNELLSKIPQQNDALRQLHEEVQKIKIEDSKKKQLSLLQAVHRAEVKEIQQQIDKYNEESLEKYNQECDKFESLFAEEEVKSKNVIKNAKDQLETVLQEFAKVKEDIQMETLAEQSKWMDLRQDIADHNIKIMAQVQSHTNSRPVSSMTSTGRISKPISPLPPLEPK